MSILGRMWKTREIRNSLLFVLAMIVVFRVAAHVPVPGVDASALANLFEGSQFLGLLNIFSGGTLKNFSLMALGVGPYITASIVFQLLGMIFPKVEEMQKEEAGRQKINQWSRLLTVPLAILQAYSLLMLFKQQTGASFFTATDVWTQIFAIGSMTAGTVFLMWIGELISEKKVGNGTSLIIFAGIVAGLPTFVSQALSVYDRSQIVTILLFAVLVLVTIVAVVVVNEAQRDIPIQYARQVRGSSVAGAVTSHIPLKLTLGGVIPIIFAVSIILFPSVLAQFFVNARTPAIRDAAQWVIAIFQNQLIYGIVFFVLVFAFTFFYASVVFHPDTVAENLQKQGSFVPGIRPGKPTAEYLLWVTNRLMLAGAIFLALIAILPLFVKAWTGNANLAIGGTSVLIVVAVIIDSIKQIEAQFSMHQYDV